mgnify:CR=1 FL=1
MAHPLLIGASKWLEGQMRAAPVGSLETLLESLQEAPISEIEEAWAQEIESRVAAYDRGELKTISAEEVFAEARRLAR